jgi:nitrogen fixation/metabolism regulation signal transduction histidine kinase
VVEAFERMAKDIDRSQSALEAARRRTASVLKNVATGVVALDREMRVMIANPRVEDLLAAPLPSGAHIHVLGGADWVPVWKWVRGFLNGRLESDATEFVVGDVQIRAQISAMHGEPSGCVLALDDTTELARAVRVLAWGELARQIAHEIKNPLTPIRLGVQHLKRAYGDPRGDFGHTLDRTARQILAEIERLDSIARAFARFGAPLAESGPLASADLVAIAKETAELYALGGEISVIVATEDPVVTKVRKDEVKEVLVNLIENARDGDATEVRMSVEGGGDRSVRIGVIDNGRGIPKSDLPHVFEPQFSTTTSGTGLGLAICKRLVESWGGRIELESDVGVGTTVKIELPATQG